MTSRVVKNQLIFRLSDPTKSSKKTGGRSGEPKDAVYHARRPHRKSRTGCLNCRTRRVKCDETKPKCRKCDTHGICCDYVVALAHPRRTGSLAQFCREATRVDISLSGMQLSMSMVDLADRIERVIRPNMSRSTTHNTVRYFSHFKTMAAQACSLSNTHKLVMGGEMIQVAFQAPYLMHAIFGVALTHLRHLLPHDTSYAIFAGIHWHRAIQLYRKEISQAIDEHNMDPLLSACMLLSTVIFAADECNPSDSWIFSSDPTKLSWLLGQSGLQYILEAVSEEQRRQSIWLKVFQEYDDADCSSRCNTPGLDGLHRGLAELCEINETTTGETSPYHWPLRLLSPMLSLRPDGGNFSKLIPFMGRLDPAYTSLLQKKDPRALLILSYWLGKMCEEKQWWIYSRAHSECFAICMYLEHSEDERIVNLLRYPAERCGYIFRPPPPPIILDEMIGQRTYPYY
ncbi:hypothetical protein PABG_05542 [Paracoccidioides brasiliensis Pb03]|nr:hypothetical protein PABG_05542 [Paracoccidioides brasiliensis Pb03]